MKIPFTKAHGARNDFLLTWERDAPADHRREAAVAICDRHSGVGSDGWYLISPVSESTADTAIHLYNSDGSEAELSGNGTRCVAALLVDSGLAGDTVRIETGAGLKQLRLTSRAGRQFQFEMDMGVPECTPDHLRFPLAVSGSTLDATILNVGNPQCAVFVESFDAGWRALGAAIERHSLFPDRTNVSFARAVDQHTIDVLFWERGAGETMSSGTGSTGAAAAAILRGLVRSPVRVLTPAGPLEVRWDDQIRLVGPAEIVASGEFYWP
jgi:diaminopimelate epimerase